MQLRDTACTVYHKPKLLLLVFTSDQVFELAELSDTSDGSSKITTSFSQAGTCSCGIIIIIWLGLFGCIIRSRAFPIWRHVLLIEMA